MAERRSVEPVVAGSTPVIHPGDKTGGRLQPAVSPALFGGWKLPEWITTREASELSGYHIEYLRNLIRMGRVYAEKKGRDWWVDRDRFLVFLAEQKASGDPRRGPRTET